MSRTTMPGIQLAVARYFVCESECSPKLELLPHEMVYFSLKPCTSWDPLVVISVITIAKD